MKTMYSVSVEMTDVVVTSLQASIKSFGKTGLKKIKGESVIAEKSIVPNCRGLFEVGKLSSDLVNDVLDGLSKSSHTKFAKHFADICSLQGQSLLGMNDIPGNLLEQIKKIFADAITAFTSFNLAGEWHIGNACLHAHACWNCGGNDHNAPKCPKPKNPELYKKNRDAYRQSRSNGGDPRTQKPRTSRNGYTRGKFGPPKPGESIRQINGVWHGHCSLCNWNTSHTTHFHDEWDEDKDSFAVPSSHPLACMIRKYGNHPSGDGDRRHNRNRRNTKQVGPGSAGGSAVGNVDGGSEGAHKFSQDQLSLLTSQANKIATETENPSTAAIAGVLKSIFEQLKG